MIIVHDTAKLKLQVQTIRKRYRPSALNTLTKRKNVIRLPIDKIVRHGVSRIERSNEKLGNSISRQSEFSEKLPKLSPLKFP